MAPPSVRGFAPGGIFSEVLFVSQSDRGAKDTLAEPAQFFDSADTERRSRESLSRSGRVYPAATATRV
jgi:hypothetical protein